MKKQTKKLVWPPQDEVSQPLVKKTKVKKPFIIEAATRWPISEEPKWYVYKRYETAKQRDQALEALNSKLENRKKESLHWWGKLADNEQDKQLIISNMSKQYVPYRARDEA